MIIKERRLFIFYISKPIIVILLYVHYPRFRNYSQKQVILQKLRPEQDLLEIINFMYKNRYEINDGDAEEGFVHAELQTVQQQVVEKKENDEDTVGSNLQNRIKKKQRAQFLIKEKPKLKLGVTEVFPLTSRKKGDSEKYIKSLSLQKTVFEQPFATETLNRNKVQTIKDWKDQIRQDFSQNNHNLEAIIKSKRNGIGEDLILRASENLHIQKVKDSSPYEQPTNLFFKKRPFKSSHEFFKQLIQYSASTFVKSKYNNLLRQKLQKSSLKYEQLPPKYSSDTISFETAGQCGNINSVFKVSEEQYNIYLNVDTNTKGHEGWFYFSIYNQKPHKFAVKINICNVKRKFPMIKKGQCVYFRERGKSWNSIQDVEIEPLQKYRYKVSFILQLQQLKKIQVSLIPVYTYSDLLQQVETYESSPNAKVQILTYSLTGLAIPMITITKGARVNSKQLRSKYKNLYLLTARIHPSETCSSFIVTSFINEILTNPEYDDFLRQNTLKIIPMVNPDGVIFGNFRTNYLGVDLNRGFHHNDETLYPEIVALKQLGRKCKQQYGNNFMAYIDLHGHSSQPSSFTYGPQYIQGSENYVECRILPKIFDRISMFFRYDYSSFRLEEYKFNTARGYFFKKLKIPSYTIETSYGLYCKKLFEEDEKMYQNFSVIEWSQLGRELLQTLKVYFECVSICQEQKELKRQQSLQNNIKAKRNQSSHKIDQSLYTNKVSYSKANYLKYKKQILFQIKNQKPIQKVRHRRQEIQSDSDGENIEEDLLPEQKQLIIKNIQETIKGRSQLPKVFKETLNVQQSAIPTLYIGSIGSNQTSVLQRISSKLRNKRYNRPVSISQEYTQYLLKNITGVASLRPEIISFNPKIKKNPLKITNDILND